MEAMKTARFLSAQLGGAEVTIFHGASHGLLGDGGRAFCELHLPGTTHRVGCFSDYLISTNAQLAKENPKNYSHALFGFSEGGIVIRNSLENVYSLDPSISQHIDVYTYGSAAAVPKYLAGSVDQRASMWDPIPLLDVMGRLRSDTSITIVEPVSSLPNWMPRFDHSSLGGTAQKTWYDMCVDSMSKRGSQ